MSVLQLPGGLTESNLSNKSIAPLGVGDDFPVQPLAGFLIVRMILPDNIASRLITADQRSRELDRLAQQVKTPLRGVVVAVGKGIDHSNMQPKPVIGEDGEYCLRVGDTILFRPLGSYEIEMPGDNCYRHLGDQDVLAVEKR